MNRHQIRRASAAAVLALGSAITVTACSNDATGFASLALPSAAVRSAPYGQPVTLDSGMRVMVTAPDATETSGGAGSAVTVTLRNASDAAMPTTAVALRGAPADEVGESVHAADISMYDGPRRMLAPGKEASYGAVFQSDPGTLAVTVSVAGKDQVRFVEHRTGP